MKLFTIGFTKKNAELFFGLLGASGATLLIDTRLNNVSQLAGFTKRDDLKYFARELCGMEYEHEVRLAPTADSLRAYKDGALSWSMYEKEYLELLRARKIEDVLDRHALDNSILLCSEATPHHCHRRLAAEYLARSWGNIEIVHL